ncbi:MAG TPA: helix-turn-helix domain-containing protein [Pyrinomonadaceae bacterium]|nr:helix-turn-helix domain-containing protein [Pyrinomonadaceae bacterium]
MNGTATLEHEDVELMDDASDEVEAHDDGSEEVASKSKTKQLKNLALSLLMEVQALSEVPTLDIKNGIDFYQEVSRFEVDLIQRALAHTGGNQVRAARLLNMKVTTLNSKIKHYNISVDVLVGGYSFAPQGGSERRA